jgi:hypothetical protein
MLRAALVLAVGGLLASCGDPVRAVDECKFETQKAFPMVDVESIDARLTVQIPSFFKKCMTAKGYSERPSDDTASMYCGPLFGMDPRCYKKKLF